VYLGKKAQVMQITLTLHEIAYAQ